LEPDRYRPPSIPDDVAESGAPPSPAVPDKPATPAAQEYLHPADGDWPFKAPVFPGAVAKVDAIRDQALSLGWSEAKLYQNRGRLRFPVGGGYGLVCFLEGDQRVGEVTARYIEILHGDSRTRFYNPQAG